MKGILWAYLRGHHRQDTKRRSDGVGAALDGELDDVLGIEVGRVRAKRGCCRVLDALIDRQDGDIARPGESTVVIQGLQAAKYLRGPIAVEGHDR